MTERLELRFEWLDAPGVREEALARTFARFEVHVGETCVTRAFDALLPSGSVREDGSAFDFSGVQSLVTSKGDAPLVVTRPRRLTALRFDQARALYALLSMDGPRLVTAGFDPDQQASRAFAAELLAPAEYLRSRVKSRFVDQERLQQLATALKVDTQLIRHQVENHELATIVEG